MALMAVMGALGGADIVFAQGAEFGRDEYVWSCAACHGIAGKGDGTGGPFFQHTADRFDQAFGSEQRRISCLAGLRRDRWQGPRRSAWYEGYARVGRDVHAPAEISREHIVSRSDGSNGTCAHPRADRVHLDIAGQVAGGGRRAKLIS